MKLKLLIGSIAVAMFPTVVLAEITPNRGEFDARVRIVDYNAQNVVRLATFYGVSTHIQFADGEAIQDVAVGDEQAWKIVPRGNHLFIKPQAQKADTNVTVITTRRTYQFALVVQPRPRTDSKAWADPNLIFSLTFRYPADDAAKATAAAVAQAQRDHLSTVRSTLADAHKSGASVASGAASSGVPGAVNSDYWVNGSAEISPTKAWDDGRFIYLTFNNNRDMPAVYSVDERGNESLINTNVVDGNTIVIQRTVRKLILRKGGLVAGVINKSFDIDGGTDNTSGTVTPQVIRVIKGVK